MQYYVYIIDIIYIYTIYHTYYILCIYIIHIYIYIQYIIHLYYTSILYIYIYIIHILYIYTPKKMFSYNLRCTAQMSLLQKGWAHLGKGKNFTSNKCEFGHQRETKNWLVVSTPLKILVNGKDYPIYYRK